MINRILEEKDATSQDFLLENYKGLVFECEGTLVNSIDYFFKGWKALCQKYELTFTKQRFYSLSGMSVRRIMETILNDNARPFDKALIDYLVTQKLQIQVNLREQGDFPTEITCVTKIVKQLHGKIPMAIVGCGNIMYVLEDLHNHRLTKYFDAIVTHEDVQYEKPAPDLFLEACSRIQTEPTLCLCYFGLYSDIILKALQAAEMDVVDVSTFVNYPN